MSSKLSLKNTTLYTGCWGNEYIGKHIHSLLVASRQVEFSKIVLLAPLEQLTPFEKEIEKLNIKTFDLRPMKNKIEWNRFFVNKINDIIDTDYCINVEHDATIIDASKWTNEFFDYDYIGAPWHIANNYENRVGNGGFSLRSKKLLEITAKLPYDNYHPSYECAPEDWFICIKEYSKMKQKGVKFAPPDLAFKFSVEHPSPDLKIYDPNTLSSYNSFGFHGIFNKAGMDFMTNYETQVN